MFNLTPMVKKILIINVVVLIATFLVYSQLRIDLGHLLGINYIFHPNFFVFQYATYMWLHADHWHLIFNMFAVVMFGPMLERVWGSKRFLLFYLVTGIGAGILFSAIDTGMKWNMKVKSETFQTNPNYEDFYRYIHKFEKDKYRAQKMDEFADQYYQNQDSPQYNELAQEYVANIYNRYSPMVTVGASGAVFGILMAFAMLFPNTELMLLFPPIPIKAKYFVLGYGALEIYQEINRSPGDNVAHFAHLSGMLIAYIMLKYWARNGRSFY